jgi:hypothetical protein
MKGGVEAWEKQLSAPASHSLGLPFLLKPPLLVFGAQRSPASKRGARILFVRSRIKLSMSDDFDEFAWIGEQEKGVMRSIENLLAEIEAYQRQLEALREQRRKAEVSRRGKHPSAITRANR